MGLLLLCHPTCTTCKKAQAWLEENHLSYQWRDIREQNPSEPELTDWLARSGLPIKRFFNTSGMAYRAMGLTSKLAEMTPQQQLALLATDGMLVKRPILVTDSGVLVGFRQPEWEKALLSTTQE